MRYPLSIIASFLCLAVQAQQKPAANKPATGQPKPKAETPIRRGKVQVLAMAQANAIKLRWAVSDPFVWALCNKYGFEIERYTVSRDGKLLPKLEKQSFTPKPLKPWPMKTWEAAATANDYAAVMAQALYGESFSMDVKTSSDPSKPSFAQINNRITEMQQRYGAFYFAADFNFEAARMGACGFLDSSIRPNEKYLYRIFTHVPTKLAILDTALSFCSGADITVLPKLTEAKAIFGNKSVTLAWDHAQANNQYSAYYIEKRKEGEDSFKRITPIPISAFQNAQQQGKGGTSILYYTDSLAQNNITYQYRIIGANPFAINGPYSDTVSGRGLEMLSFTPNIASIDFDKAGKVIVNWDFENEGNALIKGFELKYAMDIDSQRIKVQEAYDPTARQLVYDIKDKAGYYTIEAIPFLGKPRASFPYLIQPEDSIPPAAPVGFTGWVDSSGLVILHWKPNTERDFVGYRLFKKQVGSNEYAIVTDSLFRDTVYFDFASNKLINHKVYYELRAYDRHFNPSQGNELALKKPDIIPPTAPVFSTFLVKQDTVLLSWINSSDDDLAKTILLRKKGIDGTGRWDTVFVSPRNGLPTSSFVDLKTAPASNYTYALVAVDEDGNASGLVNPLAIKTMDEKNGPLYKISSIVANREERNITIKWQALQQASKLKVQELQLYRGEANNKMFLYKILNAKDLSFKDTELTINTQYKYGLRAVIEGAMPGEFVLAAINY